MKNGMPEPLKYVLYLRFAAVMISLPVLGSIFMGNSVSNAEGQRVSPIGSFTANSMNVGAVALIP
jgi:hypothetical protein